MKIGIPININKEKMILNKSYIDYVTGAGFEAVLIYDGINLENISNICDGLLLTGGTDVDPTYYGYNNINSKKCDIKRDKFERELIDVFSNKGKKIFGICRGFQLIMREYLKDNDLIGITYRQDIKGHNAIKELKSDRESKVHDVFIDSRTLYGEKSEELIFVNSIHHQAIILEKRFLRRKVDGFKICATTKFGVDKESIIEAVKIKKPSGSEVLAVQWHPEELKDYKLIKNFFKD